MLSSHLCQLAGPNEIDQYMFLKIKHVIETCLKAIQGGATNGGFGFFNISHFFQYQSVISKAFLFLPTFVYESCINFHLLEYYKYQRFFCINFQNLLIGICTIITHFIISSLEYH